MATTERIQQTKKKLVFFLIALFVVIIAYSAINSLFFKVSYLCPDNVTIVNRPEQCAPSIEEPKIIPKEEIVKSCPNCNDHDDCSEDICSEQTGFKCVYNPIIPCFNGICSEGEFGTTDCPACKDYNSCTIDGYDYKSRKCTYTPMDFCCGNSICEANESFTICNLDCEQSIALEIMVNAKQERIPNFFSDLAGSDTLFLTVKFGITNLNIEADITTITGETGIGYYFDPFKIFIKDENNNYFESEFDSDLLPSFHDYMILRKGQKIVAHLAFVIPRYATSGYLVAQSQDGVDLATIKVF